MLPTTPHWTSTLSFLFFSLSFSLFSLFSLFLFLFHFHFPFHFPFSIFPPPSILLHSTSLLLLPLPLSKNSGGKFRSTDLQVMGLPRFHCATPLFYSSLFYLHLYHTSLSTPSRLLYPSTPLVFYSSTPLLLYFSTPLLLYSLLYFFLKKRIPTPGIEPGAQT